MTHRERDERLAAKMWVSVGATIRGTIARTRT
jgi:hypothetical protein